MASFIRIRISFSACPKAPVAVGDTTLPFEYIHLAGFFPSFFFLSNAAAFSYKITLACSLFCFITLRDFLFLLLWLNIYEKKVFKWEKSFFSCKINLFLKITFFIAKFLHLVRQIKFCLVAQIEHFEKNNRCLENIHSKHSCHTYTKIGSCHLRQKILFFAGLVFLCQKNFFWSQKKFRFCRKKNIFS